MDKVPMRFFVWCSVKSSDITGIVDSLQNFPMDGYMHISAGWYTKWQTGAHSSRWGRRPTAFSALNLLWWYPPEHYDNTSPVAICICWLLYVSFGCYAGWTVKFLALTDCYNLLPVFLSGYKDQWIHSKISSEAVKFNNSWPAVLSWGYLY